MTRVGQILFTLGVLSGIFNVVTLVNDLNDCEGDYRSFSRELELCREFASDAAVSSITVAVLGAMAGIALISLENWLARITDLLDKIARRRLET